MNESLTHPEPGMATQVRNLLWNEMGLLSLLVLEILILIPWYRAHALQADQQNLLIAYMAPAGYALLVMYAGRYLQANQTLARFYRLTLVGLLLVGIIVFSNWVLYPDLGLSLGQQLSNLINSFAIGTRGIPTSILLVLTVIFLWWRGVSLSTTKSLDYFGIRRSFRMGLLILGIFGVVHRVEENSYLIEIGYYVLLKIEKRLDIKKWKESRKE